jgi:predicted ThiF/HesA family dinucleotide-utilizing enzyme
VGGASSGAVFGVGVDRYGAATEYYLVESVRGGSERDYCLILYPALQQFFRR